MSTRERLSKLKKEIDELLSEVEKKPEINLILNRMEQLESKFDKIDSMENLLKSKTEMESAVRTEEVLEKVGEMDSKIVTIGEDISSLKKEFTEEITSLRKQVGNIIEAIIDLVKTIAPEIIKPETAVPLEPLEKMAEEGRPTETKESEEPLEEKPQEVTPSEAIPETTETIEEETPSEEQSPTILTQLEEREIPERLEEEPVLKELPEVSETEGLTVETEVKEGESELDSFLTEEDEKLLKELGLNMVDYAPEEKIELTEEETTPSYVQLANLETRKLKLEREINDLKTMIQAGFGSLEDEKKLEEKIREKEEIEIMIREIETKNENQ
ncbi:MAG: hypothetical protein ACETWM_06800 [Candidatus Lokiarchaeia archaeon]